MNLVVSLLDYLQKKGTKEEQKTPEGYCPNCWGYEEYGGHFYESVKNENFDAFNKESKVGWVQDYANKHLSGITMKRKDGMFICEKCKISYRQSDEHTAE